MSKTLNIELRPKTLSSLYGQEKLVSAIRAHMSKRPPAAWMFVGHTGSGKTSLARIMSVSFNCQHMKLWGDPCSTCYEHKDKFAIHEINAADKGGIDELAEIVEMSQYKPTYPNGKRVIIIDECSEISKPAQKMLLKPTEDIPEATVWIFCTNEPAKIIPPLRRRFTTYQTKTFGITETEKFLAEQAKQAGITMPLADLYEQCHLMQVNSPGLLLQALEKYAAGASANDAVSGVDSKVDAFHIAQSVCKGDWNSVKTLLKDATGDEVRLIRAVVAGYLRTVMSNSTMGERAAVSIQDLCTMPFDEGMNLPWLFSTLYRICKRYGKG